MLKKTTLVILCIRSLIVVSQECDDNYKSFSKDHSACLSYNRQCSYIEYAMTDKQAEMDEIVNVHNQFRSTIAMGSETRGGGLPSASNMLQMTWDKELADIAQKWAWQCRYEHDCEICRATRSYPVAQNMALREYSCVGNCELPHEWTAVISQWYAEIDQFQKALLERMRLDPSNLQFSHMAWAHTYKVGCGYVSFRPAQGISQQIYVCNYSPAPEHLYPRLYKPGTPCTECPVNSCCDTDPTEPGTYAGLCRLYFAPAIYLPMAPLRFYCSFIDEDPNCNFKNRGQTPYKLIKIPGGNLLLTEMGMGTPPASAWFPRTIIGKSGACLVIVERNAQSADLGVQQREKSKLQVILHIHEADRTYPQIIVLHLQNSWVFMTHHVPLTFDRFFTIELLMTPRSDGLPLFIEIKEMMVNDIPCQYG